MSKDKTTETTTFTLHGYIKAQIARRLGFWERTLPDMTWKSIFMSCWLKTRIAVGDLRTFLVGSKTDDELCGRRWFYLIDKIRDHKALEPDTKLPNQYWERHYQKWFDKLVELEVESAMAHFEMDYHRTGRPQYSWSRDDMSAEEIAKLPDWWFDGTKAKRKLREINGK